MNDGHIVKVKYFAWLRERVGVAEEEISISSNDETVGEFLDRLIALDEKYAHAFEQREFIKVAINQKQVDESSKLENATEIAFFPPMTGG